MYSFRGIFFTIPPLFLLVLAVAVFAFFVPPIAAIAQEVAASTKISVAPVIDSVIGYVSAGVSALLAVVIGFVCAKLYAFLGINIEAKHREALHSALMTGVNAGLAKVSDLIGGKAVDVKSSAVAEAVNYVMGAVPDAVKFFGLTEAKLTDMVTAKLQGQLAFAPALEVQSTSPAHA